MWHIVQIAVEVLLLVVAAWFFFAATFEPLRSRWRPFGKRPVKHGAIVGMRITASVGFILGLVILVADVLDLAAFTHGGEGR